MTLAKSKASASGSRQPSKLVDCCILITEHKMPTLKEQAFEPSQFKLQSDGTFRISIRAAAAMAGVNQSNLSSYLKSVSKEGEVVSGSELARSLVAQGLNPAVFSSWGETGGIPEDGLVAILKHYGFRDSKPIRQAADALLAFAAVGINAYLKELLGFRVISTPPVAPVPVLQPLDPEKHLRILNAAADLSERFGPMDERDCVLFKDLARNVALNSSCGSMPQLLPALEDEEYTISDAWLETYGIALPRNLYSTVGKAVAALFREQFKQEPPRRQQFVDGAPRSVKSYRRGWLLNAVERLKHLQR
jgi:hypothetical protein